MRQINERINWLEKAISTLRAYRKKGISVNLKNQK